MRTLTELGGLNSAASMAAILTANPNGKQAGVASKH